MGGAGGRVPGEGAASAKDRWEQGRSIQGGERPECAAGTGSQEASGRGQGGHTFLPLRGGVWSRTVPTSGPRPSEADGFPSLSRGFPSLS